MSSSMDDLRSRFAEEEEDFLLHEDDDFPAAFGVEIEEEPERRARGFLGMTAGERAFLSVVLFLNVLLLGAALLLVTGRISL